MANANSFADVINRQNGGNPIIIQAPTTLHQNFLLGGAAALLTVPNPMSSIDAGEFFPNFSADGRPFILRAGGKVTGGEQYVVEVNLGGTLNQVVATTGLSSNGQVADNWLLEIEAMWDSTSTFLRGIYYGWAGATQVSQGTLATVQKPANLAALQFGCAVQIASANANALFSLTEFSGEFI